MSIETKAANNEKKSLKWYHWVGGIFLGLTASAYIFQDSPSGSSTKCKSYLPEGIKSIDDSKNFANCAFQRKDDVPVAVGQPAELITVRFSADLTQCIWEEKKVTESTPFFTRNIPLTVKISKYIDTGKNYLIFSCSEPDQRSADGNTLLSRNQEFITHGSGPISGQTYGVFMPLK